MIWNFRNGKALKLLAVTTLVFFLLYGLLITCFPLLPFWLDEWFIIDNIKFKISGDLWKQLDHTQQFPRVYLQIIKLFSAKFDYSYTSLRLPSFLAHSFGLVLLYNLSGRVFGKDNLFRFLWVMIYVAFSTSIHYFVQLKQYTMEMALGLVGMWQLLELIRSEKVKPSKWVYLLLCLSFIISPFFSYTYPIVIAPVYLFIAFRAIQARRWNTRAWAPLFLGVVSITIFYYLDVRHVLADPGMQDFWKDLLMKSFNFKVFFRNTYMMFSNLGTGDLFGNVFGVLGVAAFLRSTYAILETNASSTDEFEVLQHYSCLLVWLVIGLFIAGKLPLGTFRLNSFAVPAIGIMIVRLLLQFRQISSLRKLVTVSSVLIFLALVGAVYTTIFELLGREHAKSLRVYQATDSAIHVARKQRLPIFVTSNIAYPFEDRWPGDWILRTHPAYKVYDPLPIYALPAIDSLERYTERLPNKARTAILLDGDIVRTIRF